MSWQGARASKIIKISNENTSTFSMKPKSFKDRSESNKSRDISSVKFNNISTNLFSSNFPYKLYNKYQKTDPVSKNSIIFSLLRNTKNMIQQKLLFLKKKFCWKICKNNIWFQISKMIFASKKIFHCKFDPKQRLQFLTHKKWTFSSTQFCCVFIRISSWFYFNEKWKFSQGHTKNSNWMNETEYCYYIFTLNHSNKHLQLQFV